MNNKWNGGIEKKDASLIRKESALGRLFSSFMEKHNYVNVVLPTLDYADSYVLNNEFHEMQNLLKTVAGNGEVLALANDITAALIAYANNTINRTIKLSASKEVVSFFNEGGNACNKFEIGAINYGVETQEYDAEIISDSYEFAKSLGVKSPKIVIGNTNVFQGLLNMYAGREEKRERLKSIIAGNISSDVDYATSQAINGLKEVEGGNEMIKDLAEKIDNKQSIDGLLNLFEITNILDAYNLKEQYMIKLKYLGDDDYFNGSVFEILDDDGNIVIKGGRIDCVYGKTQVKCLKATLNVNNCIALCEQNGLFNDSERRIIIGVASSRTAQNVAYKLKCDLVREGMIVDLIYNAGENVMVNAMQNDKDCMVTYVTENGSIVHS